MYEQVPGSISFGNKDFAVSLGRLSIDLHEAELEAGIEDELNHDYYVQMAAHLLARNWNEGKRFDRQSRKHRDYENRDDPMERGFFYEGMIDIPAQSDREEATDILRWVIDALEDIPDRSDGQNRQLEEARELWASL
jgi:hypothetical protein